MKKIYALLIAATILLTACQPTPEENVVINKGDDNLEQIIASNPVPEIEYIAPETWQDNLKKENVTINIDAIINVPEVTRFPVVGVDYIQFDKSYVDKAIEVFFGEAPPLEYTKRTKEYLENYILQEKERLATIENDPEYQKGDKAQLEEKIKDLQEEYQTAPSQETSNIIVDDTSLKEIEQGMSRITLSANLGDKGFATLDIWNVTSTKNSQLAFSSYPDEVTDIKTKSLGDNTPNGVSISIVDAIDIAENALKEMGVDDMTLTKTSLASLLTTKTEDVDTRSDNEAYMLTYEKSFGGIVVTNYQSKMLIDETSDGESNTEQYAPRLISEQINIMIDDSGIISFIWKNPTISTEIISENVAIKELNNIKEIFKQHIFYHQWYGDSDGRLDIYIERVELSYFLQPVRNSIDVYRAIPVWDFIGVRSKNGKEPTRNSFENTFLTINAIDGSIIDRSLGY